MPAMPTSYPLGAPAVSGTSITVDMMLNEPTRITRYLSDLTLRRYIAGAIFSNEGSVSGGAVIYDQLTMNDLFPDRDVQHVEPGAEFPIVTNSRVAPKVAQVEKFGGKFFVTDEARDRNDTNSIRIPTQQLANAVVRKTDSRALAVLDAEVTAFSRTITGSNWSTAKGLTTTNQTPGGAPVADIIKVQLQAETEELGVVFDTWIVNPIDYTNFTTYYGAQNVTAVLASVGITMRVSNRVTPGTAYAVQGGAVGGVRYEQPFQTETWREPGTQRTWSQSSVRPVFYVTNPMNVLKVTGLQG